LKRVDKLIHQWAWVVLLSFCILGLVFPVIGIGALICMLAPVIVSFFKGRKWCGNYCPRGSFNDIILSKLTLKRKIPALLRGYWFRIIFLAMIMSGFGIQLFFSWGNIVSVGQIFMRMIIITTLLSIVLGIGFSPRTWCLICPMGTIAHFVTKGVSTKRNFGHIGFVKERCIDCRLCVKSCPVNIDILSFKLEGRVNHADCLQCVSCVEKCPKKALYVD